MSKKYLLYIFILVILQGCSKYGFVRLNYPLNPAMYFPEHVQSVAMVNRSLTKPEDKQKKVIENVLTAEIAGSDKRASDECLRAVYDGMDGRMGMRFVIPQRTRLYGTGTREVPELLDWNTVKNICDSTDADALLVLETFDSNSDLVLRTVTDKVMTTIQGGKPDVSLPNQVNVNIVSYWRLYDPQSKTIIDQYKGTRQFSVNAVGPGLTIPPPDALPNAAYALGEEYISRYIPSYYTVKRDMYKRGKGSTKRQFKAAFRSAEMAEWENAIDRWKEIEKRASRKTAGRACLDIAVAYEVLGNTDLALEWARKSYQDYNNKLARDYVNVLLRRKRIE